MYIYTFTYTSVILRYFEVLSLSKWETSFIHFPSALPFSALAPALESPVPLRLIPKRATAGSRWVKEYRGNLATYCNLLQLDRLWTGYNRGWQVIDRLLTGSWQIIDRFNMGWRQNKRHGCESEGFGLLSASSCSLNGSSELFEVQAASKREHVLQKKCAIEVVHCIQTIPTMPLVSFMKILAQMLLHNEFQWHFSVWPVSKTLAVNQMTQGWLMGKAPARYLCKRLRKNKKAHQDYSPICVKNITALVKIWNRANASMDTAHSI